MMITTPPCFRCEDGTSFDNCQQLIEFLSKPHDCQVEVRMFAIVDNWTPKMEELGEAKVDEWFYFLECCNCAPECGEPIYKCDYPYIDIGMICPVCEFMDESEEDI